MNIIVTGASRGIGYEIVRYFAKENKHNIIAIARNGELLQKLASDCKSDFGCDITPCTQDVCDRSFAQLKGALQSWDRVDILINNAGFLLNKPFEALSSEDWIKTLDINLLSIVDLVKYLMPLLSQSDVAHIVNIGSMGGFQGSSKFPGLAAYSVSKGALAILSECLAAELKDQGIRSNCLCLGAVNTEMLAKAFPGYTAPLESYEMAAFIADFSLKAFKFMNGQVVPVALSNP